MVWKKEWRDSLEKKEFSAYFTVLEDTMEKKTGVLEKLYQLTKEQEGVLSEEPFSMDGFLELIEKKTPLVEQVSEFDAGFQGIYDKMKPEMETYRMEFAERIMALQGKIKAILEKGALISGLEEQNKIKLEIRLNEKKQDIKKFKRSSSTVSNYYKNMTGAASAQSFFLDKKK